ncbi:CapA family protein [Galbibacter mesophilus]|uniref:CapA family protein n=1 Tax=Galbibacter mesophilus TaxID=379069 RepID=UPI00191F330F|nr:CapA family protein [Galbibacter mesophilus]MCM5663180.1 CapA family protein [Galbibacter mesophilus]
MKYVFKLLPFSVIMMPLIIFSQSNKPWNFKSKSKNTQSIILLGDNNIQHRENPSEAYKYLIPTFKETDFIFVNLEGPFAGGTSDTTKTDIPHKNWRYSNPDQVEALSAAGIDAVGVANNVTYPYQALMKSLGVLDKAGIKYAGGGKNIKEAHQPVIIEKKGLKVGFMQYAATVFPTNHAATENQPGIAQIKVHTAYQPPKNVDKPGQPPIVITWMDENSKALMVNDIKELRKKVDVVIVSYHWGVSDTYEPVSYQSDIGKAVIDAGADVVFGHGPHRYQKVELHQGKPIFHSLGQAAFDDLRSNRSSRYREGLMVHISVEDKKLKEVSLVPTWREDDNFLRLYDPNQGKGKELFEYLQSVNESGAPLIVEGQEIKVEGIK